MYNDIVLRAGTPVNCWACKAKILLKIKIFLWYLKNGVVLTKDNDIGRGVQNVAFVRSRKQFNTSFLIDPWLDLCGFVYVLLLVLVNRLMCNTLLSLA
jgi:hypothetical protein